MFKSAHSFQKTIWNYFVVFELCRKTIWRKHSRWETFWKSLTQTNMVVDDPLFLVCGNTSSQEGERQTKFMFKPVYMLCVISVCLCYILCLMLLILQDVFQEAMGYNRVLCALKCDCNWYCCFSFSPCVLVAWCDVMNFVLGTVCLHWHGLCHCKRAVLWQ